MVGVNIDGLMKLIVMLVMFSTLIALINPDNWFIPTISVCIGSFAGFTLAHENIIK